MSGKIKILYIIPTLDKGGAERFVTDLMLNLDRQAFAPALLLFKRGGEWLTELASENIPVTVLEKKYRFDPLNFWKVYRNIKMVNPDIVHTQLGGDVIGRLAAKIAGVRSIISTEQNVNPDEDFFMNLAKRITAGWSTRIVAISEAVKLDCLRRYKLRPDKLLVIPNGVPLGKFSNFAKGRLEKPKRLIVLGTVGRLCEQKGHWMLISALARLERRDLHCLIAGNGPLRQKLSEQIKRANLEDQISLVGTVSNIPGFLSGLDIFVFPSLWEGQGIAVLEAGLMKLPVISTAVDGLAEMIDESTAWPVKAGDTAALAERIRSLVDSLGSTETIERIENLHRLIISNYDIKKVASRYENLYRKIIIQANENTSSK